MRLIKVCRALATLAILAGLVSCGDGQAAAPDTLTVLGPWTGTTPGTEGWDFGRVLNDFSQTTHIPVHYVGTRSLNQVLQAEVQKGDPPDLADLPSPEDVADYANKQEIFPLDNILNPRQMAALYSEQWRQLEKAGTNYTYAVVVKADVKSIIWYDPQHLASPPATWNQLLSDSKKWAQIGTTPWCLGVASTSASGWPGTDWIADILLHQSGEKFYREWIDGTLSWTSPQVTTAWKTWGGIIAPGQVYGGSISALLTGFNSAGAPMFDRTPGCYLDHEASFIMPDYEQDKLPDGGYPQPGINFNFFQFPEIGTSGSTALQVSADFMAMFTNSPAARSLITYLAGLGPGGREGQSKWPEISGSGAFSVDQEVPLSVYKTPSGKEDPVSKRIAELLASRSNTLCFDAADLMPPAMQTAFYLGILEYLQDPNNKQLMTILGQLDQVRTTVYPKKGRNFLCGAG